MIVKFILGLVIFGGLGCLVELFWVNVLERAFFDDLLVGALFLDVFL